jgi:hypothetical protein
MHGHDLTPLLKNPQADWPHPALLIYTIGAWGDETMEIPDFPALRPPARGFRAGGPSPHDQGAGGARKFHDR